jgi:homoserine dehydrogenase
MRPVQHLPTRIALLGCGNVGREVAAHLAREGHELGVELVSVLVRDTTRDRGITPALITDRFEDVLDAAPDIIIELIGDVDPAGAFVERALHVGIDVVTANKTLIARRADHLARLARDNDCALEYEAAVGAGIPIIAALRQLAGDRIESIRGVLNGSCNYILTRMANAGLSLEAAIAEAAARGLVEPDPTADISGRDSAEKLCVLAREAGFTGIDPSHVACTGIERITREDLRLAARSGKTIKLIAELERDADHVRLRVGPTLVDRRHPLASVDAEDNAFIITTRLAGPITLRGKGAGPRPTTAAILGDVIRLARRHAHARSPSGVGVSRARTPEPVHAPSTHPPRASTSRRPHRVRVDAPGIGADAVLEAIARTGLHTRDVLITRAGVCIDADGYEHEAWDLSRELGLDVDAAFVAPVLDE